MIDKMLKSIKILLMAVLGALATATDQPTNGLQCQRIAVPACQGLGYNMTLMPNLAGHDNQLDAGLKIDKLLPLIDSGCSKRARFLLCSTLFPLCTPDVPRPVTPCKSLCDTVQSECSTKEELKQLWPDFLVCDTLPQPENHELCMQIPKDILQHEEEQEQQEQQTEQGNTVQPQQQLFFWPFSSWKKLPDHLTKPIHPPIVCPHNFTLNPLRDDDCLPQCNRDAFYTTRQKKQAESLILGLSAVCFALTLFALVTFCAQPTRFGYPERPVLFMCLCYILFSICYLERIVFHNSFRARAEMTDSFEEANMPCTVTSPCLGSYIATSYLSLCAATWWFIFALCYFLSSHKNWSSEALEKKSGIFHVFAWVPPLVPPITALLMERVRPNELTGMCSAPGFVEVPTIVLLLLGLLFTIRASHSLRALQQQMQEALDNLRFSHIRKRFLIFSLVFFLPTAAGVIASFLERYVASVSSCTAAQDCAMPEPMSSWPTLVRICFQMLGGTFTGMWVWSRKTCESYRNRLVAMPTSAKGSKTVSSLTKKHLQSSVNNKTTNGTHGPLYSGINFHNIPVYDFNHSRV